MNIQTNNNTNEITWKNCLNNKLNTLNIQKKTILESEKEIVKELFESNYSENPVDKFPKINNKSNFSSEFMDLGYQIRCASKKMHLGKLSDEYPEKSKLKELYFNLKKNKSPPEDNLDRINYKDFKKVGEGYSGHIKKCFSACTFLKFDKDKFGRIDILYFFTYLVKKLNSIENKINLCYYDEVSSGFLLEKNLDAYIKEEFKGFYFKDEISNDIVDYYYLVAQRKFFFFLDPKKTGRIYINDIVCSNLLSEFLEMKEKTSNSESESLWFSKANFFRIYKKYIELDKDRNGMLSKNELIRFRPGLTRIFIDRVFEEYQKYENAFDFKQFIEFCLAMDYKKSHASLHYLFKIFDVNHNGKIDTFIINMFFKQIVKKLLNRNKAEYKVDDIKDEIWDMVKPKNQEYITLEDIQNSPNSDIILPILFDAKSFYDHDQREMPFVDEFIEIEDEYTDYN